MLSAYPPGLGQQDPRLHFTYCANPHRPVAGLDQIWYSGFTLTRVALRKMFHTKQKRRSVLQTGLPAPLYPSDHLPIGAVFDWRDNANNDPIDNHAVDTSRPNSDAVVVRALIVTHDQEPPTPKAKSPIMAYAEMDMLLCTCPFDSEEQRIEVESIVEDVADVPLDPNQKPSEEQFRKLREMRERKKVLLMNATEPVQKILQRILKLKKVVAVYEQEGN